MTAVVIDLAEERFRRDVERLHELGPRAVLELLVELGQERLLRIEIEHKVRRYAEIDPAALSVTGADRIPHDGTSELRELIAAALEEEQ